MPNSPKPTIDVAVTQHPAFPQFRRWVETGGVVRSDLLDTMKEQRRQDWVIVWEIWLAGRTSIEKPHRQGPLSRPVNWDDTPFGRIYNQKNGSNHDAS